MVRNATSAVVAAGVMILSVITIFGQTKTTPAELQRNPDRYDGQVVTASGTITKYQEKVSRRGNPYTVFSLTDEGGSVSIYSRRHEGLRDGLAVTVTGRFAKVKQVGSYTFYNEVEADTIKPAER